MKRAGDDGISGPADIVGRPAGSQAGSAQLAALESFAETHDAMPGISSCTDFSEACAGLAAGLIDAVVNSLPNLLGAARQRPDVFAVVIAGLRGTDMPFQGGPHGRRQRQPERVPCLRTHAPDHGRHASRASGKAVRRSDGTSAGVTASCRTC